MNNWQNEFMAEYHRQEILKEVEQIRSEELALQVCSTDHSQLFERIMFNFANWMISTGKQLHKRYEAAVICSNSPTRSFAN